MAVPAVQQGRDPSLSQPTLGTTGATVTFSGKVPWRVAAPDPAWTAHPSSDVISTTAEPGSHGTSLHQAAAPTLFLCSFPGDLTLKGCYALFFPNVC